MFAFQEMAFPLRKLNSISDFLVLLLLLFETTVSLCSSGCPGTHYIDQVNLKLTEICLFLSSAIRLPLPLFVFVREREWGK